mmetsp:Transcript_12353/g.18109  ORF Transcript_12353/g.18109 Transcript_12353/m.18109 type:complete len:344 (+) Transcript_12353:72-1103(+)
MHVLIILILLSTSRPISSFSLVHSSNIQKSLKAVASGNGDTEQQVALESPAVSRMNDQMDVASKKMEEKASKSLYLSNEALEIIHEDEHIVVINKPAGILSVPGKSDNPSLNKVVFDVVGCSMGRMDMMVVHRLGMDVSGLMVFAKTKRAVKGMNRSFRERDVKRLYEALVAGHIEYDEGFIELPLMRDLQNPPHMRVSTDEEQRKLIHLTVDDIDKKFLEAPKESLTKYTVIKREELEGLPVTRVLLDSVTGRANQLNVHLAAFGHPIVGDTEYGAGGGAVPFGGLTPSERDELVFNPKPAPLHIQEKVNDCVSKPYVHAKAISFEHPATGEEVSFSINAPF